MSYSYKCYSDTKDFMKKFVNAEEGAIIYGISKSRIIVIAREAGAVYKVGNSALINTELFEKYLERFREPARFKDIFDKAEQIRGLDDAESCYQSGDTFFEDEHNAWERLNTELLAQGYSVEEVESLRKKYESKYAQDCKAERAVSKELNLGRSIWKELTVSASAEEKQYDKETIRDRKEQPVR